MKGVNQEEKMSYQTPEFAIYTPEDDIFTTASVVNASGEDDWTIIF